MMNPGNYDLDSMSLQQLADLREWQLERLEKVTTALRGRVQTEYEDTANIKALAKKRALQGEQSTPGLVSNYWQESHCSKSIGSTGTS